jgi:benzoate/toluate 1,2-dioxygenase beta subunit
MRDLGSPPADGSRYVHAQLYERLAQDGRRWSTGAPPVDDRFRGECESFLYAEARLLDEGRFEDWLDLYADECVYWIPLVPGGGDPSTQVTNAMDDRRRLEDRVVWLRSAFVWSQIPRSRTVRTIGNVEPMQDGDALLVRSTFVLHDVRAGDHTTHAGWYVHRLQRTGDGLRIVSKQVNLADGDQAHANMSIIF